MKPTTFISCRQHSSVRVGNECLEMFFVFISRLPAEATRIAHCNRSRLIAFIVLTGFRNRKLIDGASLSPVYFASAFLLPSHLSVRSHFICHDSAQFNSFALTLFFLIYLHHRAFIRLSFLLSPDRLFVVTVILPPIRRITFISYRSLAIIDVASFTLVTFPISRASFSPEYCACVTTFSSSLLRVIEQRELRTANEEKERDSKTRKRNYDVHGDNPFSP